MRGQIGLGGGDIKLWGVLGLYLGPMGIAYNIFLSCFLGSLVGGGLILSKVLDRKTPIPFGPFIVVVAFTQIFFPNFFSQILGYISIR
jgi:leader peptidase (prepilin peptidase)/N-methyltransferase